MKKISLGLHKKIEEILNRENTIKRKYYIEEMKPSQMALHLQSDMLLAEVAGRHEDANYICNLISELTTETGEMYIASPKALSKKITPLELCKRDKPYTLEDYNS